MSFNERCVLASANVAKCLFTLNCKMLICHRMCVFLMSIHIRLLLRFETQDLMGDVLFSPVLDVLLIGAAALVLRGSCRVLRGTAGLSRAIGRRIGVF